MKYKIKNYRQNFQLNLWEQAYIDSLESHLRLDECKTIYVFFSGGKGSVLSAYILRLLGYTNVKLVFTDTKSECEDLYRFLKECAKFLGYPLIIAEEGRDIWQVFKDSRFMGNSRVDPCSRVLKREVTHDLLLKELNCNRENSIFCFGIGLFESDRLEKLKHYPVDVFSPLIDLFIDESELYSLFEMSSGIKPAYLYTLGMTHNNCGGFCVKAGQSHYRQLYNKDRERYLYFEAKEQEVYDSVPNARPFLRKTINGKLRYLTLREFRLNFLENPCQDSSNDSEDLQSCIVCSIL